MKTPLPYIEVVKVENGRVSLHHIYDFTKKSISSPKSDRRLSVSSQERDREAIE